MHIEKLDISNVRNLASVTINPGPGINFFYGENGSGKTAILEAIHILSMAKSFRNPRIRDLISHGTENLAVSTEIKESQNRVVTGLTKTGTETRIKYQGQKVTKTSEQARNIPLIVLSEESHKILDGGPRERRHWLDWSMFHVEQKYMEAWKQYYLALRHRNALLRHKQNSNELDLWEKLMEENAVTLLEFKRNYLKNIEKSINNTEQNPFKNIEIYETYVGMENLAASLLQGRGKDSEAGYTRYGPHRADIVIKINGKLAGKTLSRGQAKLFLTFLKIRQAIEFIKINDRSPIILVDDIGAELDSASMRCVFSEMSALGSQLFVNAVLKRATRIINNDLELFHVKHGKVRKMVE